MFESQASRKAAREIKFQLTKARHEAEMTQTEVAAAIGVPQSTFEAWENSDNERQFPLFALLILPKEISKPVLQFLCRCHSGIFVEFKQPRLNGCTDDELIEADMLQGKYIELRSRDPRKAMNQLYRWREIIDTMIQEEKAKQDRPS